MKKKSDSVRNRNEELTPKNPYENQEVIAYNRMKQAFSNSMRTEEEDRVAKSKVKSKGRLGIGGRTKKKVAQKSGGENEFFFGQETPRMTPIRETPKKNGRRDSKDTKKKKEAKPLSPVKTRTAAQKKLSNKTSIDERKVKKKRKLWSAFDVGMSLTLLTVCVVLFGTAFLLVRRYSEIAQIKYQINGLNAELLEKEREINDIKVELESQNRSDIIEKYAREELGMEYPKEEKITYIRVN